MLGWLRAATALASRSKRWRLSAEAISGGEQLQRDLAVELGVRGKIHVAHPAASDRFLDAIVTEDFADHGRGNSSVQSRTTFNSKSTSLSSRIITNCLPSGETS
jgi:hypothetical protein